jgi:2-polyprenyl-3-methyl-5-hydroxy-6-metoxy-1,4-benzoquinol methylase
MEGSNHLIMIKICKICQSNKLKYICSLELYGIGYMSDIIKCEDCGVYCRDFEYSRPEIKKHFAMASYTNIQTEPQWKEKRKKFFQYIVKVSERFVNIQKEKKVLDFGCSYGHLLEEYDKKGVNCYGIELDDTLRERIENRFDGVYETFEQLSNNIKFDVIAFIDSLYCVEDPITIIAEAKSRLSDDGGIIIIRVTNRVFLIDLLHRFFPNKISVGIFGDAKYNYSQKSMKIIFEQNDLKIEKIILHEKGKVLNGFKTKLIYYVPLIVSYLIPAIKITPGIIYIVKHKKKD